METSLTQFEATKVAAGDMDLVRACKNGNIAAFEELVKRYDRRLFRIAQSVTHNREDSQDVVQEAFLKAYQHLADFQEACQFSTWLIRITVNESLTRLRKQRSMREESLDDDFEGEGEVFPTEATDWAPNPEQLCWASQLRRILLEALQSLRPMSRTVFVLRDIEGLTVDQTSIVLNMSQTAVKARLWRARLHLREALSKYFSQKQEYARIDFSLLEKHDTSSLTCS